MDRHLRFRRYIAIAWLPIILSAFLVGETYFFNAWLAVAPGDYFWRSVAASLGLSMILFFPAIFFAKRSTRYIYLLSVSIAVALIFISEFLYYKYSGGFLEASSLAYAGQAIDLVGTIKTLLTYQLLLFLVPPAIVAAGFFICNDGVESKLCGRERLVAIGLVLTVLYGGYGVLLNAEMLDSGELGRLYKNSEMYNLSTLVGKAGIVNFYLESLVEYTTEPDVATAEDKKFLANWAKGRTLPAHGSDFGMLKGKNLIFIQVESLENWVIGYKINGVAVAPNLTALAAEGKYFTNYYSQIGVGNTADAEFSTLNSLYPLPDTVAFISYAKHHYAALPRLLDDNGYDTAVMHGDVATFWNRSNAYPPLGYEKQFSQTSYTIPRPVGFENLGDADFFEQSLPKLESLPEPFMATLITLSTHTPFTLPKDLETLVIPKSAGLTPTQEQYLEAVHYSDEALGKFIAGLKADGLASKSLIFIFGDHTAFIGTPDSAVEHVPLIMLAPGNVLSGVDTAPASHLDLYPTAADLLGIQYPITVLGQDVLDTDTPVVMQRVVGTGGIKFIMSSDLKYTGSADGVFADGTCVTLPMLAPEPVASCKAMYDTETSAGQASDLAVRYDLLPLLAPKK